MQRLLLLTAHANAFLTWAPVGLTAVNDDATVFMCLPPSHALRRVCRRIVLSRAVQIAWGVLVCLSTALALAVQPRYDMGHDTYAALFAVQVFCLAFFWLRMLAEVVASGLVEGRHSFLRSLWNWIELAVNVFGLLQVIPPTFDVRWMRGVAAARPLRFFVFVPWWRAVLLPLARAFPRVLDVLTTLSLALFALALVGVLGVGTQLEQRCFVTAAAPDSLFAGLPLPFQLRNVTTPCGVGFACPHIAGGVAVECLPVPGGSTNAYFSLDNFGAALLLVFKVASMDMWFENLEAVMNVSGAGAAVYLVVVALTALFLVAVVASVVFNAYAKLDLWQAPPPSPAAVAATAAGGAAERQRVDCGVQTHAPRSPTTRQSGASPLRLAPPHARLHSVEDVTSGEDWAGGSATNPLSAVGAAPSPAAQRGTWRSFAAGSSTDASSDAPPARDFVREWHRVGLWRALRCLEATTTVAPGDTPREAAVVAVIDSSAVAVLLLLLSVANIVLLAAVPASMDVATARQLRVASSALSVAFLVPVLLRGIGFGVTRTLVDLWSLVDVLGAVSGILELAVPWIFTYRVVGVLRVLRYVRLVKCLSPLYHNGCRLTSLLALLLLICATLTLYALLGMQVFAGTYAAGPAPAPIRNGDFNTIWTALLACFRAFTGDVWTRYLRAVSEGGSVATGALFFVSLQLFSCLLLFALGYAVVLLGSRDAAREADEWRSDDFPPLLLLPRLTDADAKPLAALAVAGAADGGIDSSGTLTGVVASGALPKTRQRRWQSGTIAGVALETRLGVRGDAFLLLGPTNPVRLVLLRVLGSLAYTIISTLAVVMGVVALFFERRHLPAGPERALRIVNIVYAAVFVAEMVVKWVAYGIFTPTALPTDDRDEEGHVRQMPAYFLHPLHWFDFAANVLSLAAIAYAPLRVGRVVRTVRLCTTVERPNTVLAETVRLLRHTARVVPLLFFLYVAFAVAGMQIFSGGLERCSDPAVLRWQDCDFGEVTVYNYTSATTVRRQLSFVRAAFHYDAFGPALLSVFAMTTANHWGDFMDDGMSAATFFARYNHAGYYAVYFVLALLLIRFLAARTIAAVLAAELRRMTVGLLGGALRTRQQRRFVASREWIALVTHLHRLVPPLSTPLSRRCHWLLTAQPATWPDSVFTVATQVIMLVACAFLAATVAAQPAWKEHMILAVVCVAAAASGLGVVLRVLAYGVRHCLLPTFAADVVLFVCMVLGVASPPLAFMQVAVFVQLLKDTCVGMSLLPAVRNARLLLSCGELGLLVLFVYAMVGTLVLGDVAPDGVYITEKRNFSTVIGSLLMLLDCSTFDQWHLVMLACFDGAACRSDATATCGSTYAALIFFVSFIAIESLLLGQLMLAAVVTAFTVPLFADVVEPFAEVRRVWLAGVGASEQMCSFTTFLQLLPRLPSSLTDGIAPETSSEADVIALLSSLRLPLDEQLRLRYVDVLRGFACRKYKMDLVDSHSEAHARDRLTCLTAGEHYGQLLRRRYCDEVSRLASARVGGVPPLLPSWPSPATTTPTPTASSTPGGPADHDAFHLHGDDLLIPRGALPIPSSNVFLYTFPGESNERVAFTE